MNDKTINALVDLMHETGADSIEWNITTEDDLLITIKIEDKFEERKDGRTDEHI